MVLKLKLIIAGLLMAMASVSPSVAHMGGPGGDTAMLKDAAQTGFLEGGGGIRNVGHTNSVLNNNGIPGVSKYLASFGVGHTTRIGRMITSSELVGTASHDWESNGITSSLGTVYALWNLGFDVVKVPVFNLYPLVGLGGAAINLAVHADKQSFGDYATNREYPVSMWQGAFLLNAGLGADLIVPSRDRHSFTIGLRGGYLFDPDPRSSWRQDYEKISGGPNPDLSGPYVKLILGSTGPLMWGHHRSHECKMEGAKSENKM